MTLAARTKLAKTAVPRNKSLPATMNQFDFLKQTPMFAEINDSQLRLIMQDVQTRQFKTGQIIFHEGDAGDVLYLVRSGQVRIYINGVDGSETSVILCGRPGDIFGELAVIDGLARSASAIALGHTVLYTFSREAFRAHMRRCPQLALNFMKMLSQRVRYNTKQMDSFASMDAPRRLARKLLELAQGYGRVTPQGVAIQLALNQSHLASLIGATRERTNKCLREFREKSWISLQDGTIFILDPEALRMEINR
ncbi:MAG: Crp/Fnr family transcriptional regulator [Anaerolineae bacterium]